MASLFRLCSRYHTHIPGMFHTVIWDVQYGKIRINTQYAYINCVLKQCLGVPILDPKWTRFAPTTQNVSNPFPIIHMLIIYYIMALIARCEVVSGGKLPIKARHCPKTENLQSYNTANRLNALTVYPCNFCRMHLKPGMQTSQLSAQRECEGANPFSTPLCYHIADLWQRY
jgi:hypothetical protein